MKMTYTDLLGEYNELFDNQPEEVRELIGFQRKYENDSDVQAIISYLTREEVQYKTYTHS